jgi:hypothetical protein
MVVSEESRFRRARAWLSSRKLELGIFVLGVVLRLSMIWNYDVVWSYDAETHWQVVQWIAEHGKVPSPEISFSAFHPPLYYSLAAGLTKLGVSRAGVGWLSVIPSIVELGILWAGFELYVTTSRVARVMALALAAVTEALIHIGGMVYPESLNNFWNAVVLLIVPLVFRRHGGARWLPAMFVGLLLGVGMLTKISAFATLTAIGAGAGVELLLSKARLRARILDAAPWAGTLVVCVAVCGWYFGRNVREYGTPFVTSLDLPSQHWLVAEAGEKPLLDRRTVGFFLQPDRSMYVHPFAIINYGAHARLVPVAVGSTFVDYWGYGYQGFDYPFPREGRKPRTQYATIGVARGATVGGTFIFFAAVAGYLAALRRTFGLRDYGRLTVLLVTLSMFAATVHFATAYPLDMYGVVKGVYMSFGAPPLYAAFGLTAGWAARARRRLPLFGILVASLLLVAAYSIYCRLLPL